MTVRFQNAPTRTRTLNLMIKSHLLYQLSYRGEAGRDSSEFEFRFHVTRVFFWTQSEILVNGVRLRYATLD